MRFYPLEKLMNLEDGYRRGFKIDNLQLLLIQQRGERYLIEAYCPHRGHSLAEAPIEAGQIQCPLHQYRFSATSGQLIHFTEEPCRALRTFEVTYEGNEIGLVLPD